MRFAIITIAALIPFSAGAFIGAFFDPWSLEISPVRNAMCWVANAIALSAPIGLAIWLAWRFPFSNHRWIKLAIYGSVLFPASLLTTYTIERVSLFVQYQPPKLLAPRLSMLVGDSVLDDAMPDLLFFASLFMMLSIARHVGKISLVRTGEPKQPPSRLTIQSLLTFTLIASMCFSIIVHELSSNDRGLANLDLQHGSFSFLDVFGIVSPLSSAAALGLAIICLTFASTKKLFAGAARIATAVLLLLVPPMATNLAFHLIDFAPGGFSVLPHRYDIIGAISTVLVCVGCLCCLRRAGLRIECRRGEK